MFGLLKRFSPKTLYGRAFLIVVLPVLLAQAFASYMFYERHWKNVQKHMAIALANEVSYIVQRAEKAPEREASLRMASKHFAFTAEWVNGPAQSEAVLNVPYPELQRQLWERLSYRFTVENAVSDQVLIHVYMQDGTLVLGTSEKRFSSATTYIFILWMMAAGLVFSIVAVLFLRNQIRPIKQLAEASEAFGKGQEILHFRPRGAQEVRRAGQAFIIMSERLRRLITRRTQMLAAISHDLRTPLTRMKLQLAMGEDGPREDALRQDIKEMEHMIQEYLDFARGEGGEQATQVDVSGWLGELAEGYIRQQKSLRLSLDIEESWMLKPLAFRRCLQNLVDNALRYGSEVVLGAEVSNGELHVWVEDNGPGIPEEKYEDVMQPFRTLDEARTPGQSGVGLGLSIAKDVVLGHGGQLLLSRSKMGGLKVSIWLPK